MRKKTLLAASVSACVLLAAAASQARVPVVPALPPSSAQPVFLDGVSKSLRETFDSLLGRKAAPQVEEKRPQYYIEDDKTFEEHTRKIHMRPYNNQNLEFDIYLPKKWSMEDMTQNRALNLERNIVGDIASFESEMIGVNRVYGTVSVQVLQYETSARSWLKNYILSSGFALSGDVTEIDAQSATATYTSAGSKGTLHTYIRARIMRNVVLLARFSAPLALQEYVDYLQKKMIDAVHLSYPLDGTVEGQNEFTLSDSMKFKYPASWTLLHPKDRDPSRLSVLLQSKNSTGAIEGFVRILAVRRVEGNTLLYELERQKEHFAETMGMKITDLLGSKPVKVSDRFLFSRYETYDAKYNNTDVMMAAYEGEAHTKPEIHLAVLGDKYWYIFMYMITPKENDNITVWGRNTRTFDLLLQSIK